MKIFWHMAAGSWTLVTSLGFAGDGTLPLGDGTLPLKLSGIAQETSARNSEEIQTVVEFDTKTQPQPRDPFDCREAGTEKMNVGGTISIGQEIYQILGVCYKSKNQPLEVIAKGMPQAPSASATLFGSVEIGRNATTVSGRLVTSRQNNKFRFQVRLSSFR